MICLPRHEWAVMLSTMSMPIHVNEGTHPDWLLLRGKKNYRPAWENHLSNSLHWNWVSIFHIKKNCFISHISIEWNLVSLRLKWQCTSDSLCSICTKMRHHDSLLAISYGYNWKKNEYYKKKQNQLKRAGKEERMASIFCAIIEYMESNSVLTHIIKCRTPLAKWLSIDSSFQMSHHTTTMTNTCVCGCGQVYAKHYSNTLHIQITFDPAQLYEHPQVFTVKNCTDFAVQKKTHFFQ